MRKLWEKQNGAIVQCARTGAKIRTGEQFRTGANDLHLPCIAI